MKDLPPAVDVGRALAPGRAALRKTPRRPCGLPVFGAGALLISKCLHQSEKLSGEDPQSAWLLLRTCQARLADFLGAHMYPSDVAPALAEFGAHVREAARTVSKIHRRLPPGGILVFLTGRAEVERCAQLVNKEFKRKRGRSKAEAEGETEGAAE